MINPLSSATQNVDPQLLSQQPAAAQAAQPQANGNPAYSVHLSSTAAKPSGDVDHDGDSH